MGTAALALVLTACGGVDGGTDDRAGKNAAAVAAASGPSPSVERALALMDDAGQSAEAGKSLDVDVLDNDSVTLESGESAALLHAYDPAEIALSIDSAPGHGTAALSEASVVYTADDEYAGEDEFTYRVLLKGTEVPGATAVVRVSVTAPAPEPSLSHQPEPEPEATVPVSVHYRNCDAARAAGAAPVRKADPGYGRHLDRDGDGIACE